jgi:hypothetical protein
MPKIISSGLLKIATSIAAQLSMLYMIHVYIVTTKHELEAHVLAHTVLIESHVTLIILTQPLAPSCIFVHEMSLDCMRPVHPGDASPSSHIIAH